MRIQQLPAADFYALAAKALFGTARDKRWTKKVAAQRGDSCTGIIHAVWIRLASHNKDIGHFRPSTFIFKAAKWERCFKTVDERFTPSRFDDAGCEQATTDDTEENIDAEMLRATIDKVLRTLPYREREIIKLRFGLADGNAYTLEEVGRIFKVTKSRIRQLEERALKKLQEHERSDWLRPFVDKLQEC